MCQFESLYFEDDGYVIRCKGCGNYQIAFGNVMLTLTPEQLVQLYEKVLRKGQDDDLLLFETSKCIVIPTPKQGYNLVFTKKEFKRFYEMLEIVDTEIKTLSLLSLF